MNAGWIGAALAAAIVAIGFLTAVAAAKNGSAAPNVPPLAFLAVPLTDLLLFVGLFGAALFYRRRPATHKRFMLLTVLNFLPPAIARFPFAFVAAAGPLMFFGVPAILTLAAFAYDRRHGHVNRPALVGAAILLASYPLRLMVSRTEGWLRVAAWLTS